MRTLVIRHHILSLILLALLALAALLLATAHPAFGDGAYVVQAGDTLGGIAARYGVSVDALADANRLTNRNLIYIGQTLQIPGASQSAAATGPLVPSPAAPAPVDVNPSPSRLIIPSIDLDTEVTAAGLGTIYIQGQPVEQSTVPPYTAGWHTKSARPGLGNTVLSGHHNIFGRVFGALVNIEIGAPITLWAGDTPHEYVVTQRMILPEEGMPLATRLANARWMEATPDSRLTLVTCWPAWTNTHRLVVVASEVH